MKKEKGITLISLIILIVILLGIVCGSVFLIVNNVKEDSVKSNNINTNNQNNNDIVEEQTKDGNVDPFAPINIVLPSDNNNDWKVSYETFPQNAKKVTADFYTEYKEVKDFLTDLGKNEPTENFVKASLQNVTELSNILGFEITPNEKLEDYEHLFDNEEHGMSVTTNYSIPKYNDALSLSRNKKENYIGLRIGTYLRIGDGDDSREDIYNAMKRLGTIFQTNIMNYSENIKLFNDLNLTKDRSENEEGEYSRIDYSIKKGNDKLDIMISVNEIRTGDKYTYVSIDFEYKVPLNND